MDIKTRRLIYLSLILIFLLAAPIMIFYTAGYRYNWQKNKIEQDGVLIADVIPASAQFLLDGSALSETRPLRLPNLLPNNYVLQARKDGYFPWQKKLEIKSGQTVLFYDIMLFKKSLPQLISADANPLAPLKDKELAYQPKTEPLSYFTQNSDEATLVLKNHFSPLLGSPQLIASLPLDSYLLQEGRDNYLLAISEEKDKIFLIKTDDKKTPPLELKGGSAIWGENSKNNYLSYYDNAEWWVFDPQTKKTEMIARYSGDLKKVLPLPNAPYFVFLTGNELRLTELDDRDERNTPTLYHGQEILNFWLDKEGKNVYFLDKIGGKTGLFQLEIQ